MPETDSPPQKNIGKSFFCRPVLFNSDSPHVRFRFSVTSPTQEKFLRKCAYERYRTLVQIDATGGIKISYHITYPYCALRLVLGALVQSL